VPPSPGYKVISKVPLAPWPEWLLQPGLALPRPRPARPISSAVSLPISDRRLEGYRASVLAKVRKAGDGQKHTQLRNAALALGGIQDQAGFTDDQAVAWLTEALPPGVKDWRLARQTAGWALAAGRDKPLVLEDRPWR
jgi:hypothetical protein